MSKDNSKKEGGLDNGHVRNRCVLRYLLRAQVESWQSAGVKKLKKVLALMFQISTAVYI